MNLNATRNISTQGNRGSAGSSLSTSDNRSLLLPEKPLAHMGFYLQSSERSPNIVRTVQDNLRRVLRNRLETRSKTDAKIRIGKNIIKCHIMVLRSYSELMKEYKNDKVIELPEDKITASAFMRLYDWMITDEPLIEPEYLMELMNSAYFLRIMNLKDQCWACLNDLEYCCEDTAFKLFLDARRYGLVDEERLLLTRINKFFLILVATQEFLELDAKDLSSLIHSNMLGVNSEFEVFYAVVRWLNSNWEERKSNVAELMKGVRFNLMPLECLGMLLKNSDILGVERIVAIPEVGNMIKEGICCVSLLMQLSKGNESVSVFLRGFLVDPPVQRQWVFDKQCPYHYADCSEVEHLTYKSFLLYLVSIQGKGTMHWKTLEMATPDYRFLNI